MGARPENVSPSIRVRHTYHDGRTRIVTVHHTSPLGGMLCYGTLRKITTENHLGEIDIYEKLAEGEQ